jgi:hypothetical protein
MEERNDYLIEQYFSRRITPAEKAEMDEILRKDPVFADEFGFQQKVAAAAIGNERAQLKALLQQEESKISKSNPPKGWSVWTKSMLAIAAAIALIAVAMPAVWPYLSGQGDATPIAFNRYPNEFASAGGPTDASLLQQASDAYQAGAYAKAADLFGQVQPTAPAYQFYKGVALVGATDYAAAIATLQPLVAANDPDYAAPAHYYMAVAHYLSGDKAAAKASAKSYLATPAKPGEDQMRKQAEAMGK